LPRHFFGEQMQKGLKWLLRKSRPLFHYTTAQGLLGIVQNRCLFATHAEFSNDSTECKLLLPLLEEIFVREYEQLVPKLIDRGQMAAEFLKEHGTNVYKLEAKNSARVMLKATNNVAPYFITSFCIHPRSSYEYQNGLLSQWRSYARGGFAIEFDEREIDDLTAQENKNWRYQGIITDTVVYDNHAEKVSSEKFEGMAGAFMRAILPEHPDNDEILGTSKVEDFAHPFLSVAPFLKHSGFKEEAEYRIVVLCNRPNKSDPDDKRLAKKIRFRSKADGNVVPYIALYEDRKEPLPIKAVIVGPHSQQENQVAAVELLLEQNQINADVRRSDIPFRD
jgi:hypothetical protein